MVREGADIIDIGGESTRPFSEAVSEAEETRRVIPVVEALAHHVKIPISIDTTKAAVARQAFRSQWCTHYPDAHERHPRGYAGFTHV